MTLFLLVAGAAAIVARPTSPTEILAGTHQVVEDTRLASPSMLRPHWRLEAALTHPTTEFLDCDTSVRAAIHVTGSAIWVGLNVGGRRQLARVDSRHDWERVGEALREYHQMPAFDHRGDIELVAGRGSNAGEIARAIQVARASGFYDVRYTVEELSSVNLSE